MKKREETVMAENKRKKKKCKKQGEEPEGKGNQG